MRSSRLIYILGPPSAFVRLGRYWSGVGRAASLTLGNELNFMGYGSVGIVKNVSYMNCIGFSLYYDSWPMRDRYLILSPYGGLLFVVKPLLNVLEVGLILFLGFLDTLLGLPLLVLGIVIDVHVIPGAFIEGSGPEISQFTLRDACHPRVS